VGWLAVLAWWAVPCVAAAEGVAAGSIAKACQLDVQLFCSDLDRESPKREFVACLVEEREVLTEACRIAIDPDSGPPLHRPGRGAVADACDEDFRRLCGDENDRMGFARCVHSRRGQFSDACRDALDAHQPGAGGKRSRRLP